MKKIGVLGAGQLGRMLALAGYPLDMAFSFYDISNSPTAGIGTVFGGPARENPALDNFLDNADLVTYEFENLPVELVNHISSSRPVYPGPLSLATCQSRIREKTLFQALNIPTTRFQLARSAEELEAAARALGCPVVAKSDTMGYDGKGQAILTAPEQAAEVWQSIGHPTLLVESFVTFTRELSIIAVRAINGEIATYPIVENIHRDGILRLTLAPAPELNPELDHQARQYIERLMEKIDHVGVLTLELFQTQDGLIANEMAPRVHNSGHWTIEGAPTSQFENHLRAISGLPLGGTEPNQYAAMINIIGKSGDPHLILGLPDTHLHLYGKQERRGRKLGHITITADSQHSLFERIRQCLPLLPDCPDFDDLMA